VLPILTQYLFRYKTLSIPHVGTFQLVPSAPEFNVVDKELLPPTYHLQWQKDGAVSEHQKHFLSSRYNELELEQTGERMAAMLQQQAFEWQGIGVLRRAGEAVIVEQNQLQLLGLTAVPANKVLRENAVHQMRVGNRETDSQVMTGELSHKKTKPPVLLIIAVVLLGIAILAILYFLYRARWEPGAAGLESLSVFFGW
jgi:hypothetical protein